MKGKKVYLACILWLLAIFIVGCKKIDSGMKSEQSVQTALDKTINFKEITYRVSSEWDGFEDEVATSYWVDDETMLTMAMWTYDEDIQIEEIIKEAQEDETIEILTQEQQKYAGKTCTYLAFRELEEDSCPYMECYLFEHNHDLYAFSIFYAEENEQAKKEGEELKGLLDTLTFEETQMEQSDPYGLEVSYYEEGQYKVGLDIPAGKYVAWCIDKYSGYFCVSGDANQNDIIFNDVFEVNSMLEIREGEYVEANGCLLIPMDEFYAEYTIKTDVTGTMLRVGYDIQAGEYKLQAEEGEWWGYYCIYGELRQEDILANDIFEKTTYVTVEEGQYLILSDCMIVQ